jgi:protein disulfide-isomerase A1
MFEFLKNKNIIILILIVVLLGLFFYINNKKEKYTQVSCSREVMSDIPKEKQQVTQQNTPTPTPTGKIEFRVYYTNWCGWSKKALALLNSDEFKNEMSKIQDKATLVLLDCENNEKQQCDAEKIEGFPTMKLSKNGELIEFNGPRTTEGIISFIKEHF